MDKDNKQENPSFFGELGGFMKPYSAKYGWSIFISILSVGAHMLAYAFTGIIASRLLIKETTWSSLLLLIGLVVVFKLLHAILMNLSTWISHQAAYLTLRDIRKAIAKKMLQLPLGYFEQQGSGRLKTMMVDHVEGMEKTLAHMLPELTANLLAPLVCFVWLFIIDWRLSFCSLIWIILGFSVTSGMMKDYDTKFSGQIDALKSMNQAIVEYVNGIEVIKNFGRAKDCYKKYKDAILHHASYNVGWQEDTQKYTALGMAIAPFSLFPILMSGLFFYGRGSLDVGTLFMMIILNFGIFTPLMNASSYFDQLAGMGTNAKEIKNVLDYPELKRGQCDHFSSYDVVYDHVEFTYQGASHPALNDISFHMKEGSMVALVGPSGSGKSTIAKILAGFWDYQKGHVYIGKEPLEKYSQQALNKMIAYVDQDTFLFDESIMENIRKGNPEASDEDVIEAAKKAGCDAFIRSLPEGYLTKAGVCGQRLSGGERQKIAIARAMIKNSPIMILDEATASNDPENEAAIQVALSQASQGKTLLVVAHRLSTIVHADQIVYLDHGNIQAIGTHEELLESCPDYKTQWELAKEGK